MKILFASLPADGHFNPLTGIAVHLRGKGHDLRWYTGPSYGKKLAALGIPQLPLPPAEIRKEAPAPRHPPPAVSARRGSQRRKPRRALSRDQDPPHAEAHLLYR